MKTPVLITFRGIDASPAIEDYVRRRAAKLETFSERITRLLEAGESLVKGSPEARFRKARAKRIRVRGSKS